jgi:hypothetical protein
VSCEPLAPCGPRAAALGLVPPPPGQRRLERRVGDFGAFFADLVEAVELERDAGRRLAELWDVEGDPHAALLARLWAFVAEGVAAYAELTAAEAYLPTASDWTDLRRLAALVGHRPRPGTAAQGWVLAEVDKGTAPVVPARTRVQASGTPERAAQTYEVAEDTALSAAWSGLTATPPLTSAPVSGRTIRFRGDPGFRAGQRVLLVSEQTGSATPQPAAVAAVVAREDDVGTSLVTFDRELATLLPASGGPYAAYQVVASAGSARRLEKVLRIPAKGDAEDVPLKYPDAAVGSSTLHLDAFLDALSIGQRVAIADWGANPRRTSIVTVATHEPFHWQVAPGTNVRVSKVSFSTALTVLSGTGGRPLSLYVLGPRRDLVHHDFGSDRTRVRLHPGPPEAPAHLAVETSAGLEVLTTVTGAAAEAGDTGALIVPLDGEPAGVLTRAPASGNVLRVRHGTSAEAVLGSGDAAQSGQRMPVPDAPVAHDVGAAGDLASTLVVRVDDVQWQEVPSLYGAGPAQVFVTVLAADGGIEVRFGDGVQGARPATGRGNVTAAYRVGGGRAGEVESGAISTLLGAVRGVKKVVGAGPTTGGADQDDERRLRLLAPARARAFGRLISREDAVDLALGYPGVTHAAAWRGDGVPGCGCQTAGLHVAFVRAGMAGPRKPEPDEIEALTGFLDGRRDTTVAICVCPGTVTTPDLGVTLALDPRRVAATVLADVAAALARPDGPLSPAARALGQALDPSDVQAVLHAVPGVLGVVSLTLGGAPFSTRRTAERYELLIPSATPDLRAVEP